MKTKIKRHSRAVLSIVLTLCMLVSCMTVGIIATDAAKSADQRVGATADDEALGDTTYYLHIGAGSAFRTTSGNACTYDSTNSYYYCDYAITANTEYVFVINTTSGTLGDGNKSSSTQTVTTLASSWNATGASFDYNYYGSNSYDGYDAFKFKCKSDITIRFTFTSTFADGVTYRLSSGSGGGSDPSKGTAPGAVVSGTDIMFYIESYDGTNIKLGDADYNDSPGTFTNLVAGKSYVQVTKSTAGNYQYITNNPTSTDWAGVQNSSIGTGSAGSYYVGNGSVSHTDAKTAATTLSPSSINTGTSSITLSTTCNSATGVYNSLQLYTQYYLDGTYVTGSEATASTSGKSFTLNTASLSAGSHTLKTILTDGNIFYIADTDTLTVTNETKYAVTFSATNGTITPNGSNNIGITTKTDVTATANTGYTFSEWQTAGVTMTNDAANGDGRTAKVVSLANPTTRYVKAVFAKKTYTLTKGAESNGTFTVTAGGNTITTTGSVLFDDTITVTCNPNTGYKVTTVKAGSNTGTEGEDNNSWTVKMPAADATLTVTFAKKDNSITASSNPVGGGTVWVASSSSSNTALTNFKLGDTVWLRANPNGAYNFSKFVVTYANGTTQEVTTNNSSITISADKFNTAANDGSISVVGYFTAKPTHTVTVKTNNVAYGTAIASVGAAYEGQSVTLTATENTGTFSKWVVTSGTVTGVNNDTNKSKTFTMGSTDLIITANFNAYSGTSNFYYNSYGSNGQPASSRYGARMTEAKINGQTYSYYHVTNRTETDQLFTISYTTPKYNSYDCFFEIYKDWESSGVSALFYATDGKNLGGWANMTWVEDKQSTKKFKIAIPDGARSVRFKNNAGDQDETNELFFTSGNNGWYHSGSNFTDVTGYNQSNPVSTSFWENFNSTKYTNAFNSGGFSNHNANRGESHSYTKPMGLNTDALKRDYYVLVLYKNKTYTINGVTKTITNDPEIIWLPTLPSAVPDNTETVDIYAKNGTLRDSTFNRFTNLANTDIDTNYFEYSEILDSGVYTYTSIADYNEVHSSKPITITNDVSGYSSTYATMTNVPIGAKIKLRTTLSSNSSDPGSFNNTAFKDTHYLKAYSFNGMTYEVHNANNTGVYEEVWTVRDVNTKSVSGSTVTNLTKDGKTIEVTPIYYMQDNSNCKTFYIDGYDGDVQDAWGNMLCVYPYYEGKSNSANAFGGYPGQPMLFWGGKYQMEIPLTVDGTASGASVKGLTLHNSYWDLLHRELDIRCNTRNHAQTYDYDDFYKLYKEKNPDTIIFDFKYRTKEDHYGDGYDYTNYTFAGSTAKGASDFTGSTKNGVELVTDYFGRQVDAFGNLIADANKSDYDTTAVQDKELLFVSTGYKDTYVGEYATLWAVYAPVSNMKGGDTSKKFIGYISSSMLYLNNWERRLQYTDGDSTANGRMSWSQFETTYDHLKDYYTGVPVLISYEKEIWNDSKDKAYRSDGKWYYSNKSDQISSNIIIQYNSDKDESAAIVASKDRALADTSKWTTDAFSSTAGVGGYNNIGTTTTCSAYFTNTSPNLVGKVDSGTQFADSSKSFTFRADAGGQYMFLDWVRLSNGKYYEITEKELAESPMSSNDTYIARFVKSSYGSLKISHVVEQTGTYKGTGTPAVTVTVKTGSDVQVFSQTSNDGTPIDISSYIQTKYSAYKIDISLSTTPDEDCTLQEIVTSAASKYYPGAILNNSATVTTFTVDDIIEGNVSTLRYVSHLTKIAFTYNYEITYTYNSRFWGPQSYTQSGTCAEGDFTGSKTSATLTTDFIVDKTPYEKNFRQEINWNYDGMNNNPAVDIGNNTYKMTATVGSANTVNDKVTAEFVLPYKYNEKAQGYTVKDTDVYNSSGTKSGTSYLYDSGNESVTLSTKAYSLFTYDDENHTGSDDDKASSLPLMEAAPYLMKDDSSNPISYHYKPTNSKRYYTGNSFKVGNTTYYLRAKPDGSAAGTNEVIITDAAVRAGQYTVTFTKRSNMTEYGGDGHTTTYRYAVASGTPGTLDYKVYFFAYAMNANEEMVDNEGNVIDFETQDPVFNGQYIVYSESQEKDGIIEGTGVKKYFTRWDIYNTKGDFVASCYNRRFNYSGYDNYVIKPIYDSDTENNYASSLGTDIGSSITYLDDSRNQWKGTDASGTYASTTGQTDLYAADKIFADFAITYSYNGENINTVSPYNSTSGTGADIKIGMVIERLDQLDTVGSAKITSASYYADKYKTDTDWENLATALKNGTSLTSAVSGGHKCYNSKIGANVSGFGTQFGNEAPGAVSGQSSVIDNFNRLQWFYTFNNTTQRTDNPSTETVTDMKNYAYRAISYMIVTDSTGTKAYLCDAPTYFTIYDTATRVGY